MWECEWCRKPNYEESLTCEHCGGARDLSVDPYHPMMATATPAPAPFDYASYDCGHVTGVYYTETPELVTRRMENQPESKEKSLWRRWRDGALTLADRELIDA